MGMDKFKELVEAKSDGKITVKLFPGGVLGGDVQTLSAVQGGTVEMTVLNAGLLAGNVQDFALADLPFLYDTPQQADAVMDGPFGTALMDELASQNMTGLGYWELGFRQLTNNVRPVAKVEDIAGLKIRVVQQPVMIDLFNALGANAVPMPFPEVYPALETGAIDGQENPFANILASKLYEVQKYVTVTNHVYNPQIVLVSGKLWGALNDEERQLLQQAAAEARDFQRAASRAASADARAQLEAEGLEITELPPDEVAKLRELAKPVVDKQKAAAKPEVVKLLESELAKAQGKG
jgi:tripartite ATP-independent transporter DctP family solute receptor